RKLGRHRPGSYNRRATVIQSSDLPRNGLVQRPRMGAAFRNMRNVLPIACIDPEQRMEQTISRRAFLALAAAYTAKAQDATFSTDVKVVSVLATVRDKQGKIVSNLTKDDFDLAEDGRPQT